MGSPPHTRGILRHPRHVGMGQGFTPAYAGNTTPPATCRHGTRVHPRIRGEYWFSTACRSFSRGSPPHTRGIQGAREVALGPSGFTPAYAGNTRQAHKSSCVWRVHPRIRGEYPRQVRIRMPSRGSPPHTRGIPKEKRDTYGSLGFTPAYAGNTVCL